MRTLKSGSALFLLLLALVVVPFSFAQSPVELRCDQICPTLAGHAQCNSICQNSFGGAGGNCTDICQSYDSCIVECNRIVNQTQTTTVVDQAESQINQPIITATPSGLIQIPRPDQLPDAFGDIGSFLSRIIGASLIIAAILSFLYLIWGGFQWITSGGDKTALEDARNRIVSAIVGLVIVAASWAIFQLVQQLIFGGSNTILQLVG